MNEEGGQLKEIILYIAQIERVLIAIVYDALMMTIYKKRIYRHVLSQMSTKPLALRGQKSLVQYAIYKGKPSHVGTLLEKGQVFLDALASLDLKLSVSE